MGGNGLVGNGVNATATTDEIDETKDCVLTTVYVNALSCWAGDEGLREAVLFTRHAVRRA